MPVPPLLHKLAAAFANGRSEEEISARVREIVGRPWRFVTPLAARYLEAMRGKSRPRRREAIRFLLQDGVFRRMWRKRLRHLRNETWIESPPSMQPVPAAATWSLPQIPTAGDLAKFLQVTPAELDWFADLKGINARARNSAIGHYHYRVFVKRSGGVRLIEAPKRRLKTIQRAILTRILAAVPPHPSVHGFLPGRSIHTFTRAHINQRVVLRMDLRDFFPSLTAARIQSFLRIAGYPETVADLLGGILTNSAPKHVWRNPPLAANPEDIEKARLFYARRHLPQGSPASPAVSNVCAYRLDCRLSGLARSAGARYTRYADDLAFSCGRDFEPAADRFSTHVAAIAAEEGFAVHHRKTRVMRRGVRQHLAGIVVNDHANIIREDFDRLKATLVNCVRHGPLSQNRAAHPHFRAHLEGRVAFVESVNPRRGAKLRSLLASIDWTRINHAG